MAERTRARRGAGSTRRGSSASRSQNAGGRLNRDYSEEEYREPSEGYQGEMPTKGLYTAELFDIRDHVKQDDPDATSVRWGFRLADGSENKHGDDVSGYPDFIYTTENTLWREQQMLVALGVIKPGGKLNLTYEQILKKAKPCTVKVGLERYIPEEGESEWRARMEAFLPLKDSAPKRRRAKDEDADEEDFDDDTGDDDEDDAEEDEPPARSRRSSRRKPEPEPEDDEDEDEDEEEDDEPYDADELAAELADLTLVALKKRAKDEFGVTIKRGMKADDIIDAVLDTLEEGDEPEDEEDEPEEEPEPPRRSRRGATKGNSRPSRKRGSREEPPF